jgi:CheY-like chemotaxis protein
MSIVHPLTITLLGFTPFEHTAIGAILRLATLRLPGCILSDDLTRADCVIVDSDNRAIERFFLKMRRQQAAVFVGNNSSSESERTALCSRPIAAPELVAAILRAVGSVEHMPGNEPVTESSPVFETLVIDRRARERGPDTQSPPTPPAPIDALVAISSEVTAQSLLQRLRRRGIDVRSVNSGEDALAFLNGRECKALFLSATLVDMTGYELCKLAKAQAKAQSSTIAIAMLSRKNWALFRARASLVGCDTYLVNPVSDIDLNKTLVTFGLSSVVRTTGAGL